MSSSSISNHEIITKIIIVGAGKGGRSLIEFFLSDPTVEITMVIDINQEAEGMKLAIDAHLPISTNYKEVILNHDIDYDIIIEPARNPGEDPMAQRGLSGLFMSSKDIGIDFDTVPWAVTEIPDITIGDWKAEGTEYIGVQPSSISGFKTYNPLYAIDYPGDVKSFGFQTDHPIEDAIEVHGRNMVEVYEELLTCSMVVSTHSSIGILAFYLGIPQVFIHFWPKGLANLANRPLMIQPKEPGRLELQIAIDELYVKVKENK